MPALLAFLLFAGQSGELPVPPDLEVQLRTKGYSERQLPIQHETLASSVADQDRGWMLYRRDRNFELLPNSRPAPGEALQTLTITATAGEIESEPFAVFALRDIAAIRVEPNAHGGPEWLRSAIRVEDVLFHPIQYPMARTRGLDESRASEGKTYVRYPVFLRPPVPQRMASNSSRLYWVTVSVPATAEPGRYRTAVVIDDGTRRAEIPVELRVLPFKLTGIGVPRFGAFLSGAPVAADEWKLMKRYGLDAAQWFWNSHPIRIRNNNGNMDIDFTRYDAAVEGMQDAGMRGPLVLSLGNSWLGHYEIELAKAFDLRLMQREVGGRQVTLMDMTDPRWEKPWVEGLRRIFEHAKTANWPPLALLINDEPTKHIMAYHPYRYQLVKKHFPDVPVYGVFFEPQKDPGPLLHSSDIVVANRDLDRMKSLAAQFDKKFWTYNNVTADESFGKIRLLYGQIPAYYGSEAMFFWCWNYYVGNAWDDFDRDQSDADWVAVYPSVDGKEPVRTLALEAAREAIDDVRYIKTLEAMAPELIPEIRKRQKAMFDGILLDARINSDTEFFKTTRNDDVERLRSWAIEQILARTPSR